MEKSFIIKLPCDIGDVIYEVQEVRERIQALQIMEYILD